MPNEAIYGKPLLGCKAPHKYKTLYFWTLEVIPLNWNVSSAGAVDVRKAQAVLMQVRY